MAGIKAHTRVQPVSQRRPELISPQLQQEQPAENSTIFTVRWLVAGLVIPCNHRNAHKNYIPIDIHLSARKTFLNRWLSLG
jgi:hypothetical protein